jgi:hypothetical protein
MNISNLLVVAELAILVITILKPLVVVKINHVNESPSPMGNAW